MSRKTARRVVLGALLVAAPLVPVLYGAPGTLAAFTDSASVTSGALTSGSMGTPAAPAVSQIDTTTSEVTWSASTVGDRGAAPTSYEVLRYTAASGGAATLACRLTVSPGTPLTCRDATGGSTTVHYAVRARFADSWQRDSARTSYRADTVGPVVVPTQPTNNRSSTAAVLRSDLAGRCGQNLLACGTASDPAGVESVEASLRRTPAQGAQGCWNGNGYTTVGANQACPLSGLPLTAAGDGVRWTAGGATGTAFPNTPRASFTAVLRSTDGLGNVSTTTITFQTT